jgi:hypothetical protein
MNDDQIYVRFKGKTLGPLTAERVQGLIKRGQITRMHELSSDGLSWSRAEEFGGFFTKPEVEQSLRETPAKGSGKSETNIQSRPRPGEPPSDAIEWYAHLQDKSHGPLTTDSLYAMVNDGKIKAATLVWRSGFDDWLPAESAIPNLFGDENRSALTSMPNNSVGESNRPLSQLAKPLTEPRGWILFLSISAIVYGTLSVLYFVIVMIASSNRSLTPLQGSERVIFGLAGITFNGLWITGAVLLLRYARELKSGLLSTEMDLVNAARRQRAFWVYTGIVVLILEILLVGFIAVLAVIGAAVTDA